MGRWLQITVFALHHFPAFGDQKIACFLAKQWNCSRKRITGRERTLKFFDCGELELPAASQVWSGFERTILSCVIVLCNFDGVFRVSKYLQILATLVITVGHDKAVGCRLAHRKLTDQERRGQRG